MDDGVRVPLLRQQWRSVTFMHWRYDAELLQRRLPAGLRVQEFDGSGWLSLIPLHMVDVRPAGLPALPGLSAFPETNLRTYVTGPDGRAGVWFFSLDAASTWITVGARLLLGAPYFRGALRLDTATGAVHYTGRRGHGPPAGYDIRVQPGEPVAGDQQDRWLAERHRAYTVHAERLFAVPVRHEPWPLQAAAVVELAETVTDAAGLPVSGAPDRVRYSDGVRDVAFGAARWMRAGDAPVMSTISWSRFR